MNNLNQIMIWVFMGVALYFLNGCGPIITGLGVGGSVLLAGLLFPKKS